jgi:hypothetical protein
MRARLDAVGGWWLRRRWNSPGPESVRAVGVILAGLLACLWLAACGAADQRNPLNGGEGHPRTGDGIVSAWRATCLSDPADYWQRVRGAEIVGEWTGVVPSRTGDRSAGMAYTVVRPAASAVVELRVASPEGNLVSRVPLDLRHGFQTARFVCLGEGPGAPALLTAVDLEESASGSRVGLVDTTTGRVVESWGCGSGIDGCRLRELSIADECCREPAGCSSFVALFEAAGSASTVLRLQTVGSATYESWTGSCPDALRSCRVAAMPDMDADGRPDVAVVQAGVEAEPGVVAVLTGPDRVKAAEANLPEAARCEDPRIAVRPLQDGASPVAVIAGCSGEAAGAARRNVLLVWLPSTSEAPRVLELPWSDVEGTVLDVTIVDDLDDDGDREIVLAASRPGGVGWWIGAVSGRTGSAVWRAEGDDFLGLPLLGRGLMRVEAQSDLVGDGAADIVVAAFGSPALGPPSCGGTARVLLWDAATLGFADAQEVPLLP